jgi:mycothiol synthase
VRLRPFEERDFDPVLALRNAHELAAFGEVEETADDLRRWLTTPYVVVADDIRLLEDEGRLVAYADVDSNREEPPVWWCDVKVAPDADVDAVLGEVLPWLEQRAARGRLRTWTAAGDGRLVGAYERLGFEHARHSYRMEISLEEARREPVWPDGITVRPLGPGEERRVHEAVIEVWRDTSDPFDETYEEWAHWLVDAPSFDPSLWFLALAGEELAGFSLCRVDTTDPAAGHVNTLGVRRPWRRQGLGEALLLHSFDAFRTRGWQRATLGVDASSPTGATRLYERAGMSVYRDTLFLERAVRA